MKSDKTVVRLDYYLFEKNQKQQNFVGRKVLITGFKNNNKKCIKV